MTGKDKKIAIVCLAFLAGTFVGYTFTLSNINHVRVTDSFSGMEDSGTIVPTDGYFFTTGLEQHAYIDGVEVDRFYFQEQLGVKQDGKLGTETSRRVIDYNRLDQIK